ncbi:MAG: Holliday junction resolvase RuvX [Clostridia bacterium]
MKIIGIDYGDVRTGIAISDALLSFAFPVKTITNSNMRMLAKEISELSIEHKTDTVVLGMPLNMNGTKGPRAEKTEEFAKILTDTYSLKVIFRDERSTTVSSHNIFNMQKVSGKKRKENIDSLSATIILQDYLDFLKNSN